MTEETFSVLVVDDEVDLAEIMAETLEMEGLKVEKALSGPEAIEKFKESSFDCVVSDSNMPGMKGVELLAELKKYKDSQSSANDFLFYLCTGDIEFCEKKIKELNIKRLILKPYDLFGVVDMLKADLKEFKS